MITTIPVEKNRSFINSTVCGKVSDSEEYDDTRSIDRVFVICWKRPDGFA